MLKIFNHNIKTINFKTSNKSKFQINKTNKVSNKKSTLKKIIFIKISQINKTNLIQINIKIKNLFKKIIVNKKYLLIIKFNKIANFQIINKFLIKTIKFKIINKFQVQTINFKIINKFQVQIINFKIIKILIKTINFKIINKFQVKTINKILTKINNFLNKILIIKINNKFNKVLIQINNCIILVQTNHCHKNYKINNILINLNKKVNLKILIIKILINFKIIHNNINF